MADFAPERSTGQPPVVMPPVPPGESSPAAVHHTQVIADILVELDDQADEQTVAHAVKEKTGIELDPDEVSAIMRALHEQAARPPLLPPNGTQDHPSIERLPEKT